MDLNGDWILIKGARENNLQNIDVRFPKGKLSVVTGVSGSGKSTLMFNIMCQEGERKFISASGRVPDNVQRSDYDNIYGLSPIVSVSQHNYNNNPRSTVGTYSEIYTYLRLLYTAIGERKCPKCNTNIEFAKLRSTSVNISKEEQGIVETYPCPTCNYPIENITMAHFSFNTEVGACPTCMGLGEKVKPIYDKILDSSLSIKEGGIQVWKKGFVWHFGPLLVRAAKYFNLPFKEADLDKPIGELPDIIKHLLLFGTEDSKIRAFRPEAPPPRNMKEGKYEGAVNSLMRRYYEESLEEENKEEFIKFLKSVECPDCQGHRLKKSSLEVMVNHTPIHQLLTKSLEEVNNWINKLPIALPDNYYQAIKPILSDLKERSQSLCNIGLNYLSLNRTFSTLSGGEAQRMRLSSLLNSNLSGMTCILDEPTAGLHPKDTNKLVKAIKNLRDLGNTVIVIEHDLDVIKQADYVVDIGPDAGVDGGHVVFQGTFNELLKNKISKTAQSFNNNNKKLKSEYRAFEKTITIKNANSFNLKNINVDIPLGILTAITGVSGSGKSTLISQELLDNLSLDNPRLSPNITGGKDVNNVVVVNQKAMGKVARSNAATYTKVFDDIRDLYKEQAKMNGLNLKASHFSFNVNGGRCESCKGTGKIKVQMHFMPTRYLLCPICHGKRYNEKILSVKYKKASIADILEMSIKEARELFLDIPKIKEKLEYLYNIGLGYLKLGQPATTLSGGEAQRIKLAAELSSGKNQHTLYILDEPSVGLHENDTQKLINILNSLVEKGNSVVIIEHNTSIIREADWVIELGPEGGENGGEVIAEGTPFSIKMNPKSVLREYL